jgi:hypothetical protein
LRMTKVVFTGHSTGLSMSRSRSPSNHPITRNVVSET